MRKKRYYENELAELGFYALNWREMSAIETSHCSTVWDQIN